MDKSNVKGMSIASLTLGIISLFSGFFWYIGLPTGIIAIVLGAKSVKKGKTGMGRAGMVLGIIGTVITLFIYISLVFLLCLAKYM